MQMFFIQLKMSALTTELSDLVSEADLDRIVKIVSPFMQSDEFKKAARECGSMLGDLTWFAQVGCWSDWTLASGEAHGGS